MAHNHPAVAALPTASAANKTLVRNMSVATFPYCATDDEDVTDLVAVDPDTGAAIIDILFLGRLFHYDPTDTTTANDGISCLVTFDNRRYKLSDGSDVFAYSVLDNALATPPGSPTIGDAYLIAAGATGAWSGKADYIGTFTRRGWEFINYDIGRFVYVESVDTYFHRDSGGSWVSGFGNQTFGPNSVPLSAAINFGKRLIVENQTTNAPPGSPSIGDAYIIGSSPTGSWAGKATKVAVCEDGATFTIYTPANGWSAFDKTRNGDFNFIGSGWISSIGALVDTQTTSDATYSGPFTQVIPYDDTVPQITEGGLLLSTTYTPKSTTNKLRVRFESSVGVDRAATAIAALFRDSIANALNASPLTLSAAGAVGKLVLSHEFVPGTTSPITLTIRIGPNSTAQLYTNGGTAGRALGGADKMILTIDEIVA